MVATFILNDVDWPAVLDQNQILAVCPLSMKIKCCCHHIMQLCCDIFNQCDDSLLCYNLYIVLEIILKEITSIVFEKKYEFDQHCSFGRSYQEQIAKSQMVRREVTELPYGGSPRARSLWYSNSTMIWADITYKTRTDLIIVQDECDYSMLVGQIVWDILTCWCCCRLSETKWCYCLGLISKHVTKRTSLQCFGPVPTLSRLCRIMA